MQSHVLDVCKRGSFASSSFLSLKLLPGSFAAAICYLLPSFVPKSSHCLPSFGDCVSFGLGIVFQFLVLFLFIVFHEVSPPKCIRKGCCIVDFKPDFLACLHDQKWYRKSNAEV